MFAGLRLLAVFAILGVLIGSVEAAPATVNLTIQGITWNIVGLDSNNVNAGPNMFPVAVRVCNTGTTAATNVSTTFVWDTTNALINLTGGTVLSQPALAAGACTDFYYTIAVTRTAAAYDTTRRFRITVAADGFAAISTPTPREIFVERLVSQNRNSTISITSPNYDPASNTSYLALGQTYQITVTSNTATNGYEQLEVFFALPYHMFRIVSVRTTYSVGGSSTFMYANACGWDNVPTSPTYRSCLGTGKAGGNITTVYTFIPIALGSTTATNLIYDFSGSSYHFNSDITTTSVTRNIVVTSPTAVTMASMTATSRHDGIMVRWNTSMEDNTTGFWVYRTATGTQLASNPVPLNAEPLPANGIASRYQWLDQVVESGVRYDYWIEAVDADGSTHQYGPVSAQARYRVVLPLIFNQP